MALLTSSVTLTELFSTKASDEELYDLKEDFLAIPNLKIFDISQEVALLAAKLRRESNIRIIDSLQLAAAIVSKADVFLTNDLRLKKFKKIRVLTLEDF